jgi:hypothetical protein
MVVTWLWQAGLRGDAATVFTGVTFFTKSAFDVSGVVP